MKNRYSAMTKKPTKEEMEKITAEVEKGIVAYKKKMAKQAENEKQKNG